MSDDVKIKVSVDDAQASQAFKNLNKNTDDFTGNFTKGMDGVISSYNIFEGAVAAGILLDAFNTIKNAITGFVNGSVQAFSEQEDAINKLKQSFILTGQASQSAVDGVQAFATALESNSRFADENIIAQVAYVKSLGTSTSSAKEFVKAAANMSAVLGGSLEENTAKLGLTLSGTTGRLSRLIPELKTLTAEQLKNGDAAEIINKKFGGSSANDLNTYAGSVAALKNSVNNLQESLGQSIVKSGFFQDSMSTAKKLIDDFNQSVTSSDAKLQTASGGFGVASKTAEQLALDYNAIDIQVKKFQASLEEHNSKGTIAKFFDGSSDVLQDQIDKLTAARDAIEEKIKYSSKGVSKEAPDNKAAEFRTQEQLNTEKKLNADLFEIKLQSEATAKDFEDQLFISQQDQAKVRTEIITQAAYEAEMRKVDAVYQGEIEKNKVIEDSRERQLTNDIAFEKKESAQIAASRTKRLADEKAAKTGSVALELSYQNSKNAIIAQGFQLAATLAKDGSTTQFIIQKAAAIAEIIIADGKARALIPAQTAMIPFPANLAAIASLNGYVTAQTAIGSAIVLASALKFETGGIVPGLGQYGDQVQARLNPGEMVLNKNQQSELMDMANGKSNNGNGNLINSVVDAVRNISLNVVIDGREIARTVRDQRLSGFAV